MAGFNSLLEVLVSCTVELGGNGMLHGGKGILLAGARKIGWASKGSAGRQGQRFSGHSLAGKSLASGFGSVARGRLGTYNPKAEYKHRASDQYRQAMRSGSGAVRYDAKSKNVPDRLHGRKSFDRPPDALGRDVGHRFVKQQSAPRSGSFSKNPRGFIRY